MHFFLVKAIDCATDVIKPKRWLNVACVTDVKTSLFGKKYNDLGVLWITRCNQIQNHFIMN